MPKKELLKGRELDAEVAVRILEWEWWAFKVTFSGKYYAGIVPPPSGRSEFTNKRISSIGKRVDKDHPRMEDWDSVSGDPLPYFSDSVDHAWTLLDWLDENYTADIMLEREGWRNREEKWVCVVWVDIGNNKTREFEGYGKKPAEAICMAILTFDDYRKDEKNEVRPGRAGLNSLQR